MRFEIVIDVNELVVDKYSDNQTNARLVFWEDLEDNMNDVLQKMTNGRYDFSIEVTE